MATTYLTRTPASDGNRKTWTFSAWVKRTETDEGRILSTFITAESKDGTIHLYPDGEVLVVDNNGSGNVTDLKTNRLLRDTSGYYNIVVAADTTQAVAANRVKLYINGVQETSFATETYPAQDTDWTGINEDVAQVIGRKGDASTQYFNGLMTHIQFVDGLALAPTEFGDFDSTSGIWKIKNACYATPGTNGYCLKMETTTGSAMGTDSSGNGNNFTEAGSPTQAIDNPSNVLCTLNPLFANTNGNANNTTQGSLTYTSTTRAVWNNMVGTLGASTGKYYWEVKYTQLIDASTIYMSSEGVGSADLPAGQVNLGEGTRNGYGYGWLCGNRNTTGNTRYLKTVAGTATLTTDSNNTPVIVNDVVGVAWDGTNGKLWFHKNGTWIDDTSGNVGDPTNGTYPYHTGMETGILYTPWSDVWQNSSGSLLIKSYNFGNGYFGTTQVSSAGTSSTDDDSIWEYDCPTGFYGLNTNNINTYG